MTTDNEFKWIEETKEWWVPRHNIRVFYHAGGWHYWLPLGNGRRATTCGPYASAVQAKQEAMMAHTLARKIVAA